jgi:hypothetical protein
LIDFIRATVRRAKQPEVQIMGKTIAEALMEEGEIKGKAAGILEGKRDTLLQLLRAKFKRISPAITAEIEVTQDVRQLDTWLAAVLTAESIGDIPFQSGK